MRLIINGHKYHYALESLIRVFYPDIKIEKEYNSYRLTDDCVFTSVENCRVIVRLIKHNYDKCVSQSARASGIGIDKPIELQLSQMLYSLLTEYSGYTPKWGIQTGVRPSKLFFKLEKLFGDADKAAEYLKNELYVNDNKIALVKSVCNAEKPITNCNEANDVSIYISIPFCPTRCSYCSFISHSYEAVKSLIPEYVGLICKELEETKLIIDGNRLNLKSIYIGGGTPTILSEELLEKLLSKLKDLFDIKSLVEYTVEAGRPDTLTRDKLKIIHKYGVNRITINAQSFNDNVLKAIGRNHTADDIRKAYESAREIGFDFINTDLIAGLTGESFESFCNSVNEAVLLNAENITVHTLALKRSSFLITRDDTHGNIYSSTSNMLDYSAKKLTEAGYIPYYMYRQSKSIGNLENVGWCKPEYICKYNIYMMEEIHSIFGIGAGAVTRLKDPSSDYIERIYNFKYPFEYIAQFDEMIKRKRDSQKFIDKYYN